MRFSLCGRVKWAWVPVGVHAFHLAFLMFQRHPFRVTFLSRRARYVYFFFQHESFRHHEHFFHDRNDGSVAFTPNRVCRTLANVRPPLPN